MTRSQFTEGEIDMAYNRKLARFLLNQRLQAGLSQSEVREGAGLGSQNLLSNIERDATDKPAFEDLVRLGKFYGITPTQLARVAGLWDEPEDLKGLPDSLIRIGLGLTRLSHPSRREYLELVTKLLSAYELQDRHDAAAAKFDAAS